MSRGFFVDAAAEEDAPALAALADVSFTNPWSEAQILVEVRREGAGGVLVARCRDAAGKATPCGSCTYHVVADEMEILDVAVAPAWRRRGVARFLVRQALRRAFRVGARTAFLEVRAGNTGARSLYLGLGFGEAGRRMSYYSLPTEDAVLMRRDGLETLEDTDAHC